MAHYIIPLVFLAVSAILIILTARNEKQKRAKCSEKVIAEVIGFTDVKFETCNNINNDKEYYNKKAPVYEYSYKGEFCRQYGSTNGAWVKKITTGTKVVLLVDPENPKHFICPEERGQDMISVKKWLFISLSVIIFIVAMVYLFIVYCKRF